MPKTKDNHRRRSFADEAKTRAQKQNPTPPLPNSKKDKTYTIKQLTEIEALRRLRYNDLLNCARNNDMAACMVFPTADEFEIPLSRVCRSLEEQVELLDIYHYLANRKENLTFTLTRDTFGPAIGMKLHRNIVSKMLKEEDQVFLHN